MRRGARHITHDQTHVRGERVGCVCVCVWGGGVEEYSERRGDIRATFLRFGFLRRTGTRFFSTQREAERSALVSLCSQNGAARPRGAARRPPARESAGRRVRESKGGTELKIRESAETRVQRS